MAFCPQCEQLKDSLCFEKPREYLELARQLLTSVNEGALIVRESSCPLQDLFNPEWPGEEVEHNFECTACGRTYQLFARSDRVHAERLPGLAVPALFMTGEEDLNSSAAMSAAMARRVPDARLEVVPGARHMMNVTHPQIVTDVLLAFL